MIKFTKVCFIFLTILLFISCNEEITDPVESGDIYGNWVLDSYQDSMTVMQRSNGLDSTKYGFIFKQNGIFMERKNAGWCATPPVIYANYSGRWSAQDKNTLIIDVAYWGGETSYKMRIISLTESKFKFVLK